MKKVMLFLTLSLSMSSSFSSEVCTVTMYSENGNSLSCTSDRPEVPENSNFITAVKKMADAGYELKIQNLREGNKLIKEYTFVKP